ALGYTLVYGILQLINFANGDVFMLGSVITLIGVQLVGLESDSPAISVILTFAVLLPVAMLLMAGLNASIERIAYRPLRRAPTLATLISAIGMSFILQNVGQKIIGPSPVSLPNLLPTDNIIGPGGLLELGSLEIKVSHLFVTAVTLPLLFGLMWFVKNTRQGKAMRATAQAREAAGLMGIDVNRTITLTFLLAGALAGGAGVVGALYNGSAWWFYG
ncbi:MAG: branched-chain amino acid ABC transporter permease, partial [Actinomycetota bacterium]